MRFFGSVVFLAFIFALSLVLVTGCATDKGIKPCEFDGSCDEDLYTPPPQQVRILEDSPVKQTKSKKSPVNKKLRKQKK